MLPSPFTRLLHRHARSDATRLQQNSCDRDGQQVNTPPAHLTSQGYCSTSESPNRRCTFHRRGDREMKEFGKKRKGGTGGWMELQRNFDKWESVNKTPQGAEEQERSKNEQRQAARFPKSKTAVVAVYNPPPHSPSTPLSS